MACTSIPSNELESLVSKTELLSISTDNIKHPLAHSWTMYYDPPNKKSTLETYNSNIQILSTVDTVESCCCLLQNIPEASAIPSGTNLSFFRSDVKPSWEDPLNVKGGKWTINIPKDDSKLLSKLWRDSIFCCIGNEFGPPNPINGVVLNVRHKGDRIAFWISDASEEEVLKRIADFVKPYLELPSNSKFSFQLHSDAIKGLTRDYLIY